MKWPLDDHDVEESLEALRAQAARLEAERRERYRQRAQELGSDGCTGVRDWRVHCCYEHDVYYLTGADLDGQPVSRAEADRRFRHCIQKASPLGVWSPFAWWRWAGVRVLGHPKVLAAGAALKSWIRRIY